MESRLTIALYTDADVDQALARELRARGFDAVSARDVANHELSDQAQLDHAIAERRVMLTHNAKHFTPLVASYWHTGVEHYGVVVSEQLPIGELLRRVLRLLNQLTVEDMHNNFKNLAEFA